MCEVRVGGYDYVGAGNSANKKDSQSNAARDFVQYLVRQGHLSQADIPDTVSYMKNVYFCLANSQMRVYNFILLKINVPVCTYNCDNYVCMMS